MATHSDPHSIELGIKRPGALRAETGTKPGHVISEKKLAAAEKSKNRTERKESNLAAELEHFRQER